MTKTRTFQTHRVREVIPLDGTWVFTFPGSGGTLSGPDDPGARRLELEVPGVWETHPGRETYRGEARAARLLVAARESPARFVFQGVSHTCEVFLDGRAIGAHHNAYTAFACNVPRLTAGEHLLELEISNAHGELSALHLPNDYYNYGGISRPVEWHALSGPCFIETLHLAPTRVDAGWRVRWRMTIRNLGEATETGRVELALAGREWNGEPISLAPGATELEGELCYEASAVTPWSPEHPVLYEAHGRLSSATSEDDLVDRMGFRTVAVRGSEVLLNGEPVRFRGINRHEDHAAFGCALPLAAMRHDLELIRRLGCNAVRTAHYPNDPRFLDLCDEQGLLVWEENHARALYEGGDVRSITPHPMRHPRFAEQAETCNQEMVTQHFNHPSIVLWGILNECDSYTAFGRSQYERQFAQVRALDPSRPVTYASCHHGDERKPKTDICQDLPDVCGWNFYHNWYEQLDPAEGLRRALGRWEEKMAGKPMIVSEFGADALPGYFDPRRVAKWSEERQVVALLECLDVYLDHPRLAGFFIWQFCDVRVDEAFAPRRPRVMNNKGLVDEHRRPKLAFEAVARRLGGVG